METSSVFADFSASSCSLWKWKAVPSFLCAHTNTEMLDFQLLKFVARSILNRQKRPLFCGRMANSVSKEFGHVKAYSSLPDRDPGGFIRTGSSIPPEVFWFGWVFLFLTPGVFIQTEVFLNWWMMLLYGPRFFGTEAIEPLNWAPEAWQISRSIYN